MATERRRWRYRDPSWPQIVGLYVATVIVVLIDLRPERVLLGLVLATVVTIFVVIKLARQRRGIVEKDAQ
ncbi:hypothetical protein FHJ30_05750 [Arthrobacter sp. BB-1]|uniref:hypothetical protein n=1 Tax=unclassified Arthrobacter TaxID=235627 RepID=UPI001112C648|nr:MULTISPECIES: hypothetical protein [unclassified Arthrobacter]TNB74199.1 hypothetical protein FHJ30_05750 [Arthrobacter sp. BB-1]